MFRTSASQSRTMATIVALLLLPFTARADEPIKLRESFTVGQQFRVQSRMKGTGSFTIPSEKDEKTTESLTKSAESDIDYIERVLEVDRDELPSRLLRIYEKIDFRKEAERQRLQNTVRENVRRMVVVRDKGLKVPFSPDGPLLIGEIELVRADVFTPALAGMLPAEAVRPGDRWSASAAAVRELTDMTPESGELTCKFVGTEMAVGRKVARINFNGSVRGVSEDGPVRHELNGHLLFDLQSHHLCYLSLLGKQFFLDKDGKTTGTIEGSLTITRQAGLNSSKLSDEACRGLRLTPDPENTLLLYDNEDLGVRFSYPRRWKVSGVQNRQVMIDADSQNGLLLTLLPASHVPTPREFGREAERFLQEQGGKIFGTQGPRKLQSSPDLNAFTIEAEMKGQRLLLDYYVVRMTGGGATLAARLLPQDAPELRSEVERIARSVVVTK